MYYVQNGGFSCIFVLDNAKKQTFFLFLLIIMLFKFE